MFLQTYKHDQAWQASNSMNKIGLSFLYLFAYGFIVQIKNNHLLLLFIQWFELVNRTHTLMNKLIHYEKCKAENTPEWTENRISGVNLLVYCTLCANANTKKNTVDFYCYFSNFSFIHSFALSLSLSQSPSTSQCYVCQIELKLNVELQLTIV